MRNAENPTKLYAGKYILLLKDKPVLVLKAHDADYQHETYRLPAGRGIYFKNAAIVASHFAVSFLQRLSWPTVS
jgi:hypothetical protein